MDLGLSLLLSTSPSHHGNLWLGSYYSAKHSPLLRHHKGGGGFLTAVSVNTHTDTTTATTTTAWWMWRQARRTGGLPKGINNTAIPPVRSGIRPLTTAGLHTIAGVTTPIQLFLPPTWSASFLHTRSQPWGEITLCTTQKDPLLLCD